MCNFQLCFLPCGHFLLLLEIVEFECAIWKKSGKPSLKVALGETSNTNEAIKARNVNKTFSWTGNISIFVQ